MLQFFYTRWVIRVFTLFLFVGLFTKVLGDMGVYGIVFRGRRILCLGWLGFGLVHLRPSRFDIP